MSGRRLKPSGVDWLGDVPEGWKVVRGKDVLSLKSAVKGEGRKIGLENIEGHTGRFIETDTEYDGSGAAFEVGDIIYGKLRPYLCKVWIAEFLGSAVGDFYVYSLKGNHYNRYYLYWMLSNVFTSLCNASTSGTKMPRVSSQFIDALPIPIPPLPEQRAIADYLDRKCGEIDGRVEILEKKLSCLKRLKKSVINRAVTRGVPGKGEARKLKPSGVDWLGDVPEEWGVVRGKDVLLLKSAVKGEGRKIGLENIEGFTGRFIDTATEYDGNGAAFEVGDIIYGKLRPYLCKVWIAEFLGSAVGDFYVYSLKGNNCNRYYLYWMLSDVFTSLCNASTSGTKMPRVSSQFIDALPTPIPPLPEQREIADYLDRKCAEIDAVAAKVEKEIDLYKRLKKSLINEVVTGKREVA